MYDFTETYVKQFREEAAMLRNMAGVYPGDMDGSLSKMAFTLDYMADIIEDVRWKEIEEDYEDSLPKIEVTVYDQAGNVVPQ